MNESPTKESLLHLLYSALTRPKTKIAPPQTSPPNSLPHHPTNNDIERWRLYWQQQQQPWRTMPEIDTERKQTLASCRTTIPDIKRGIYPFGGLKLSRADVEWLLATHENGRGPINWHDITQRKRQGLDLRGADLKGIDLSGLPLARTIGGLTGGNWADVTIEQREMASVHLENAYLKGTYLEGAILGRTHLEHAHLGKAHLEEAYLRAAHLEGADFGNAHLEKSNLGRAYLVRAYLREAHLEGANLEEAHLEGASLRKAYLGGKSLSETDNNTSIILRPANLRNVFFDAATNLQDTNLGDKNGGYTLLADIFWNNVNLAVVGWSHIKMTGDEYEARKTKKPDGSIKSQAEKMNDYQFAIRANRQLATALRQQGLNEEAAHFSYRAQVLERKVLWWQHKFLALVFSWFLFLLTGYGYRPIRSMLSYLFVIGLFTGIYFALGITGPQPQHLQWYEALVVSLTAFHGRGFFSEQFSPGDPQSFVAAIEAAIGLLIEVCFIATFTQKFFGK